MSPLGALRAFANPIGVSYSVTNVGGTQWRYDYTLAGPYLYGNDLSVYFPVATSLNLSDLATGGTDWSTFVFQPDSQLPADGEFDMIANISNPSLAPVFRVVFQWSGSGTPGAQSFTLYDSSFNAMGTGITQPSVTAAPEPASLVLLSLGLAGLWLIVRKRPFIGLKQ
jgi:hypothetical protein